MTKNTYLQTKGSHLTKKEFAERCGMTTSRLAVYALAKNGKVVYNGDRINPNIEPNKSFLEKWSQKNGAKIELKATTHTGEIPAVIDNKAPKPPKIEIDTPIGEYAKLEMENMRRKVNIAIEQEKKLKISNEKSAGNFIPAEHVKLLLIQLSESIHLAWENELDDFILKFAAKNQLTREEIAELKKEKIATANMSRQKAIQTAKTNLRRLQIETANKRGVGEHD